LISRSTSDPATAGFVIVPGEAEAFTITCCRTLRRTRLLKGMVLRRAISRRSVATAGSPSGPYSQSAGTAKRTLPTLAHAYSNAPPQSFVQQLGRR